MKQPTYVKDIQKLIGCMAALSRFISCLGEKGLPFFKLLKASERFSWSKEADTAFEQLKLFLTKPSIMTVPQPDETLLSTSPPLLASLAQLASSSLRKLDTPIRCNVWSTSSARFLMSPKLVTLRFRSYYTPF